MLSAETAIGLHPVAAVQTMDRVLRLIDMLEEHDDVQKVWANYEIPDEELERIAAES